MGLSVNQLINCADDNPIRFSPRRFDLYAVERLPQCVRAARVLVYRQGFLYLRVDQFGKKGYVRKVRDGILSSCLCAVLGAEVQQLPSFHYMFM